MLNHQPRLTCIEADTAAIRYAKARGLHTEYIPGVPDITAIHKNNLLPRYSKN